MNTKWIAGFTLACIALTSCDDTTDTIGSSLTKANDGVAIQTASFDVFSRSIAVDSVLSRNTTGYLGRVKDPETGVYVTGNFMAQFNSLENYQFPTLDSLVTYDTEGNITFGSKGTIKADSCELRLFFNGHYGDAKESLKMTVYEMSKSMNEDRLYYSNFDPMTNGYIRKDGLQQDKMYNLVDYNVAKSRRDTSGYTPYITVKINGEYTDVNGQKYNNYGAYILQQYYNHPEYLKNAFNFRNHVVPGFYFKIKSGLGNMATIVWSQLNVYFKFTSKVPYKTVQNGQTVTAYKDSVLNGSTTFWGTEEVLQSTTIENEKEMVRKLAEDESCTYLKAPAAIFTELTLPIEEMMKDHSADRISSAKIALQRLNNNTQSDYEFGVPENVLMVPKDSLYQFFEGNKLANNKTSYLATWSTSDNSYTFHNISNLVSALYENRKSGSADWNKVVIVPVSLTRTQTTSINSNAASSRITKVSNDMSLKSTRLVKGTKTDSPIKMSVIYTKFK